jgi:hypothetical protein
MAKLRGSYALDRATVEDGMWVKLRDGIEVKVRSVRSEIVKKVRARAQRPYERLLATQKWRYLPEQEEKIAETVIIEGVLLDWRNIEGEDGKPLPFNRETVKAIITDPEMVVFREDIMTASGLDETFRRELAEEIAGNSPAPSASSSSEESVPN